MPACASLYTGVRSDTGGCDLAIAELRKKLRPLGRLLREIYARRVNLLFDVDLTGAAAAAGARAEGGPRATPPLRYRTATREEVLGFASDSEHEVSRAAARRHLALLDAEDEFFVGLADERVVYRAWVVRNRWRIAGPHHLTLGRGKATIMGCFTIASFRGRGIYPAALEAHLRLLKERGVSRVFINVEESNVPSRRGIEKAGFRRIGTYEVRRRVGQVTLIMDPVLRRAIEADYPE